VKRVKLTRRASGWTNSIHTLSVLIGWILKLSFNQVIHHILFNKFISHLQSSSSRVFVTNNPALISAILILIESLADFLEPMSESQSRK
jgi:hypothetical protein